MVVNQLCKKQEGKNAQPDHQPFGLIDVPLIQEIEESADKAAFYQ